MHLNLRFEDSEVAHELVRTGGAEVGVVTLDPLRDATVTYTPLWRDALCFVAGHEHHLARAAHPLASLHHHPVILPGMETYTGRIIADLFARRGLTLKATMSTNYLETIRMLVSIGLGWSALPASMLDESIARIHLTDEPDLSRDLGCIVHPGRALSNAARAFLQTVADYAAITQQPREKTVSPATAADPR